MSNALNTGQEMGYVMKKVTRDSDKPLPMLCEELGIRPTKDETKPRIQGTLRIGCSSFVGNPNKHISMYEKQVSLQYPGEDTAEFQMRKRPMSEAIAGQEAKYVVDVDKPRSMPSKQTGNGLTKDEAKPDTRYPLGLMVSKFQVLRKATSDALKKMRFVAKEAVGNSMKAAQRRLEPIFMAKDEKLPNTDTLAIGYNLEPKRNHEKADFQSATTEDEKFPNIDTLAIKYNLEPKRIHEKADFQSATAKDEKFPNTDTLAIRYNLEPKRNHEKADFQSATTKDEKFPNIDTLAIKYNLEPKRTHEKADSQSDTTKDEKFPNVDTLAIKHNSEPRSTYEKTSFQSAATKDEKFPNIDTLAIKNNFEPKKIYGLEMEMKTHPDYNKDCKEQPKKIRDQCEKTDIQSPGNIQERLVRTDELVDRSQKSGQRENSTRPTEESRTNVRIWDKTNAKALTRIYCVYVFSLFGLPL